MYQDWYANDAWKQLTNYGKVDATLTNIKPLHAN